jgi:two-component system cell cycle sensor histidine kinase/response regulator CckA
LARLGAAALRSGSAVEDVVSRRGHLRLGAHRLSPDALLWRVEDLGDRSGAGRAADALSLPMLTAGPAGTILFMNEAFRKLVGGRPRHLDRVFRDPPPVSGRVHRLEGAEGPVDCLVAQVTGPGGRREIYLVPADPAPAAPAPWDAVEELPVAVLKVSRTGEVLASNRCARALLPAPIGAGTRLSDLVEGLGRPIIDWVGDVAAGRPTAGPQILHAVGSDRENFLRVSLTLAGPPDGLHLIAVLDDVTEHKSLEAQFVQAQKMQAIGQLAGGVAHDFNNLLTAIAGHCELLLLRRGPDDPDHADLVQINHNANRAAAVVNQLLAFSRKQSLVPEVFDLRDTLSELTHLLNRLVGDRVQLVLDHGPGLDCIRADRRKLEQVIVNLVVNARDAMPAGGEICIATRNLSLPEPIRRDRATVPAGDYVEVRVADQGTGIAPDLLPKIFEPFFTTKRPGEGTGLGLSTAYGIVKQTGGFIFVDSELGRGAVFTLLLPSHGQTTPQAAAAALPAAAPASHRAEGIILLVEDEAPVRAFASRALRLRGYTVLEADSAEAALDILADPAVRVDLFVSDVMMPGMDGPSWVREALADRPGTRVIFVSGYAEEAFAEHRALIPNSSFLPKPFSLAELTAAVDAKCA